MDYMDLLSRLGVASAHPGGFKATRRLLDNSLGPGKLNILEVGCGTGKTACYLAGKGYSVTALDRHPLMLEKAKKRAKNENLEGIRWVEGTIEELPFGEETFDVVLAESVTLFTDVRQSFAEYFRVLKPGGRLLDRELALFEPLPDETYEELKSFFKLDKVLTIDEWLTSLREAGFECGTPREEPFRSQEPAAEGSELQDLDISEFMDPEVGEGIMKYAELMLAQEQYFRACDFEAHKIGSCIG